LVVGGVEVDLRSRFSAVIIFVKERAMAALCISNALALRSAKPASAEETKIV
jgi:hypothetical protein